MKQNPPGAGEDLGRAKHLKIKKKSKLYLKRKRTKKRKLYYN
jgi:hypothetical protein